MSFLWEIWRRLGFLFHRRRFDRDLEAEMQFHLDMAAREHREAGTSADEAAHAARRQFGNLPLLKERSADAWGWTPLEQAWRDLRLAVRTLGRSPGYVAAAVITLGLGIGANTLIFSVVHGVLLKPLPFEHPERLVSIRHTASVGPLRGQSAATYFTYREEGRAFEDIGLYARSSRTVIAAHAPGPERLVVLTVTDGLLPVLRIQAALGRRFTRDDDLPNSAPSVMLSHAYWQRAFGGDPGVIGRYLTVDGQSCEIVGVLPRTAWLLGYDPAMLLPFRFNRSATTIGNFGSTAVGRLKPGITLEEANRDLARMIPLVIEKFPLPAGVTRQEYDAEFVMGPDVNGLDTWVVGNVGPILWLLLEAVGMVLLIACANVASLSLVRAESRHHELAVRAALGASRLRIARELLTESLVLGACGGALGVFLARAGIALLVALAPARLPRLDEIAIDPPVLGFTLGLSVLTGVLFGLLPVLRFSGPRLTGLQDAGRGATEGRGRFRFRSLLVVTEVALALVLLIGTGLMIRTFDAMRRVEPGFVRPGEVLTFQIGIPSAMVPDVRQAIQTHEQILQRLGQIPGVVSVGLSSSLPMEGTGQTDPFLVEEFPEAPGQPRPPRRVKWVSERYFKTVGSPLLAGRDMTWTDSFDRRPVVMVSENFAREFWGTPARAIGKRIRESPENPWREIVGVVGDERDDGATAPAPTVVYMPLLVGNWWNLAPYGQRYLTYAVRTPAVALEGFRKQVQQTVWSVNKNLPLYRVRTLEEISSLSTAQTRFMLVMLAVAAVVALLLASVGIYGVVSYIAAGRTREIAVRMALGARPGQVRRLFVRQGLTMTAVGLAVGLIAALAVTRVLTTFIFGVSRLDVATHVAVAGILATVALAASYVPARRASSVNPAAALRSDV